LQNFFINKSIYAPGFLPKDLIFIATFHLKRLSVKKFQETGAHLSDFEKLDNDKIHLGWKFALVKEFEKKMWINLSKEK